jgi:hypothetical protein
VSCDGTCRFPCATCDAVYHRRVTARRAFYALALIGAACSGPGATEYAALIVEMLIDPLPTCVEDEVASAELDYAARKVRCANGRIWP